MKKYLLLLLFMFTMKAYANHCEQYTDKLEAYNCYKESVEKNRILIKEYMLIVNTMPLAVKLPIQKKHSLMMKEIKDVCKLSIQCTSDSFEPYALQLANKINIIKFEE